MNKMPAKLLAELNRQLNQELSAAHAYRALSLWCDYQNLKGFTRYFAKQSGEELGHGHKISAHLIDRGILPEVGAIPATRNTFKSLL
jgi:ferritin